MKSAFGVVAVAVIGLGALVGGVVGVLLPKLMSGISLGFYMAFMIEVVRLKCGAVNYSINKF
jgi:hypothetical protein